MTLKKTHFQTWVWKPQPTIKYHYKWGHIDDIDKHNPSTYSITINQGECSQLEFLMLRQFMLEAGFFPVYSHWELVELKDNIGLDKEMFTGKININKIK